MKKTSITQTTFIPFIVLTILLLTLLSSSCTLLKKNSGSAISYYEIHTGTKALEISFLPGAPPKEVTASEVKKTVTEIGVESTLTEYDPTNPEKAAIYSFPVGVLMKNSGAYNINSGYLSIAVEDDYMRINPESWDLEGKEITKVDPEGKKITFNLKGKTPLDPIPGEEIATLSLIAMPLEEQSEYHTSNIIMTACYEYYTEATADICLDTDIFGTKIGKKACALKKLSFPKGQGAPIAVTKIEQEMLPRDKGSVDAMFIITIENLGNGQVVKESKVREACSAQALGKDDIGSVSVEEIKFSNYFYSADSIICSPMLEDGYMKYAALRGGKATIRCRTTRGIPIDEAYSTSMYIKLKYGYTTSISTQVTSERVLYY